MLTLASALLASPAFAVDFPTVGQQLKDGETYILVNYAQPVNVWSRTSWDGAFYLLPFADSNYQTSAVTAHLDSESGLWYFSITTPASEEGGEDVVNYVAYPSGSDNLNANFSDPAYFSVEASADNSAFYTIKAGEGQGNSYTIGRYVHLNSGGQYVVTTEETSGWFPDAYGGLVSEKDIDDNTIYPLAEDGVNYIFNDYSSTLWAFVPLADVNQDLINKLSLYKSISEMESGEYMSDETYAAGFQASINAATKIYEMTEFYQEDYDEAMGILNAKMLFYQEILAAEELLGDSDDAALKNAIAQAKTQFSNTALQADSENACNTLKEAEKNFSLGTGEITSMGMNMSFEDLTAQGGASTSSVADAPIGWTLSINGNACATADEIRSAGVTAWCGVNNDADGEVMDGSYIFGIWNSGMPKVELSQSIEGLENGTYVVSAGLMAGANGNGSRLTTQRIFGNLNSTYYGMEEQYNADELDQNEVYAFAGNEEIITDRTMAEVTVRAYVYDGTLTFGLRTDNNIAAVNRTSSNSAGGDGWFKVDNFRIKSEGYIASDALAVCNHFKDVLGSALEGKMQNKVAEEANLIFQTADNYDESTPQDEINKSILELKDAYAPVKSSLDAYQSLADAIDEASENLDVYGNYAGAADYADVCMFAGEMYDKGDADEKEIAEMIDSLDRAFEACKKSGVAVGIYVTDLVSNPSFEDLSAQGNTGSSGVANAPEGWDLFINGTQVRTSSEISAAAPEGINWCAINNGDPINVELEDGTVVTKQPTEGNSLWGIWAANIPEVEISQTLTELPAGTYTLTMDVMVENNWAGDNITTQRIFANNSVQMFSTEDRYANNMPEDALAAKATDESLLTYAGYSCESGDSKTSLLHTMSVTFGVDESGIAKIGFRTNGINGDGLT